MRNNYRELIWFKALSELKTEAQRSYLGIIWWVLEPLIYMMVFYFIFAVLLKRGEGGDYVFFLLIGLVSWKWFSGSLSFGAVSIIANVWLMRQVYVPKHVFVHVSLLINLFKFSIVFGLLLSLLAFFGEGVLVTWSAIPIMILVQFLITAALVTVIAAITPVFPDMKILVDNGLMLFFFLSGIFFNINDLSPEGKFYVMLNPMAVVIDGYRDILLRNTWPDWGYLIFFVVLSIVVLILGQGIIKRLDKSYPKIILR